jgi:hypothetical protein
MAKLGKLGDYFWYWHMSKRKAVGKIHSTMSYVDKLSNEGFYDQLYTAHCGYRQPVFTKMVSDLMSRFGNEEEAKMAGIEFCKKCLDKRV